MSKLDPIGRALLGPVGSALITGKFDLANSLPGVLIGAKTREEKRALREEEKDKGPGMKRGGKVKSIKDAVHKHERNMHKNKPLTKLAKGGAAKRADGIAKKGHTKGKMR